MKITREDVIGLSLQRPQVVKSKANLELQNSELLLSFRA